ncbi:peptide chain release factor 3 [Candidatus Marinamargulisbacteria bacterium SCGC AAA071-K20]|nr:peptide chain release factor 3 [Candidatus Marinamargulisbacteria bacterium SCGC AAA071-K20]
MATLETEINKRRTFGIISHPDAGKTTLTEKLLLFGGAIHVAGAIKAKKASRHATSDFMEIEKQRGISVATSVMGFVYKDIKINLLDTPGHKDFSEDTYRTLTAVDSAVMVIDSVKGVEEQTDKLMKVCRMRNTPIMTFINKVDREGQEPIELLDEIESKLNIKVLPLSWPIGMGKEFKGVYSLYEKKLILFKPHQKQETKNIVEITDLNDPKLDEEVGEYFADKLREDIELITGIYGNLNINAYLDGKVTPVFFGSALNNFGVRELLDCFIENAPSPLAKVTTETTIDATHKKFTGFVFKIHANMDPRHRDRIAFLRICSGTFDRTKRFLNVRTGKQLKFAAPTAFMAQEKNIVDFAYPGDIIGLHDTGNMKIGDTLTEGEKIQFKGVPSFSPEIFKTVVNLDPLKTKQLDKGIQQLCEEGVAQLFINQDSKRIIGCVGALQYEVIQYRLENEYNAKCRFDPLNYTKATWITAEDPTVIKDFARSRYSQIVTDSEQRNVYLAETKWSLEREIREQAAITFHFSSETL